MRNVAKKGILTAVATGSVLASTAGYAYAGAEAQGVAAGSPGVASGNSVQVPVEVPLNACGNTVDVIGLLNPAFGNNCANRSHGVPGPGGAGHSAGGSSASGQAAGSPGVASGNSVQAPVHVPLNACGNSLDVVGVANPAFGNNCGNTATPPPAPKPKPKPKPTEDCPEEQPPPVTTPGTGPGRNGGPSETPARPVTQTAPAVTPQAVPAAVHTATPAASDGQLASTGAGGVELLGAAGLALLLGGGVLYRRARAGAR